MNQQEWAKVKDLLWLTLEQPPGSREEFLQKECGDDRQLIEEVKSLIEAGEDSNLLLENENYNVVSVIKTNGDSYEEKIFGNYRILRELGRGGMGAVFLAERADGEFHQKVALKIIRQSFADEVLEKRFRREREILALLNHPNIAILQDGGVSERGEPFLVMEYVEGAPLLEFAEKQDLSIEKRLRLFLKICRAISYAHRNLIVHRDIKPNNILVKADGEPKLLDFGLAKILDENFDADRTETAFRAFTPSYASPEQIQGKNITTASDVYSLGIVLFELLTGQNPFHYEKKSFEEILRTVDSVEPPRPSSVVSNNSLSKNKKHKTGENNKESDQNFKTQNPKLLKGDLDNITLKALRKEPEHRYKSVEELAADIERHLDNVPISARKNDISYRASRFFKRNKITIAAFSAVFLALIIGLAIALWQARLARQQRDFALEERKKTEKINKFLQQMLSFSNQSFTSVSPVAQNKNVTVNEMLDQISPEIEVELADQPEVRAKMLQTIGSAYASQGFYEKAEKNLRSALDVQLQIYGEENIETANTMIDLGVLAYRRSKVQESNDLLGKAVSFYRKNQVDSPQNSPARLIQALDFLAVTKFYLGDTKSCIALFEEGIRLASETNLEGNERQVIAGIQTDFGGVFIRLGETEKGENLLREGIALYTRILDKPRWEVGNAKTLYSESLINRGELESARNELLEGEKILRETLGEENMYLAGNLRLQASLLMQKADLENAEKKAREALKIYLATFSSNNAISSRVLVTLGIILTKAGKLQEGEARLREALKIYEQQPDKIFSQMIPNKIALGENLAAQKHYAEAEQLILAAVSEAKQHLEKKSLVTQTAEESLAKFYENKKSLNGK